MAWIPSNIHSNSGRKDRGDENVFMFKKKKKGPKNVPQAIKGFTEIKKLK